MTDSSPSPSGPIPGRAYEVLTPGEKFGDYQVLRCVSYDLLGSLYRVRKPRERQEHTIFVMPPIIQPTAEFKERFAQMAPKLCGLEHDNVLSFNESSEVKDRFTFLGGAFEGENLADYLQNYVNKQIKERRGENTEPQELVSDMPIGLHPDEVRKILNQVLEGLTFLYEHKIQHLNLNPTNILRTKDGQIKLAGYGLMNLIGQERFEEIVSAGIPPIALGGRAIKINTVDILSPEARQGKTSDARSDVYALGITAYWLLTGRKPSAAYTPPSEIVEGLDPHWDTFIANCLDRDPDNRYQTVTKAKDDFNEFEKIRPLRSAPSRAGTNIGTADTQTIFRHLEFIPVPQKVKDRGEKTTRTFRLAVLGVVLLIAGFIVFSALNLMLVDDSMEGKVAIRTPEGQEPRLSISITPDNASVRISSTDLNFIVRDGKLDLNILPGSYRFEVDAPGYNKASQLVQVEGDPQTLSFNLKAALAPTTFTSLPETSLAARDDTGETIQLGVTDASGQLLVEDKLSGGSYHIIATKEGYATTESGPFQLKANEPNTVEVSVEAILGVLRVRSDPTGADIYYEDKIIGETNATLEGLPVEEEFLITLKLDGYRESTKAVTVASQTRTILDFGELTPLSGEIAPVIKFSGQPATPEQLRELTITGFSVSPQHGKETFEVDASAISNDGYRIQGVKEGEVTMTVGHPDYVDETKQFSLGNNMRAKVIYDLAPLPAILTLSPKPADEEWNYYLNDQKVLLKEMKAPLKPGVEQTVKIDSPNFFGVSQTYTPKPNEQLNWSPTLKRIPGPTKGEDYEIPFLDIPLVWLQPGSFTMGAPLQEPSRLPEEGPVTKVRLSQGFWMGAYEVTQQQYEELIGFNPAQQPGKKRPVEYINWREATAFCRKLNEREAKANRLPDGYEYRLPTEAEWEYAARAGSSEPFHWGDTATRKQGNFQGAYPRNFEGGEINQDDHYGHKPVGSYQPNAWGLYDMHGNVREWIFDDYNSRLPGDSVTDWVRREDNERHTARGGSYADFAIHSRAASRSDSYSEVSRDGAIGMRIVLAPKID